MQIQALSKLGLIHGQFVVMMSILWLSHHRKRCFIKKEVIERHQSEFDKRTHAL